MKRIFLIIIVFSIQLVSGQGQDLERAKRFFDRTYYSEAIPLYENYSQKNSSVEVFKNLTDCYYFTNDYANAQIMYRSLMSSFAGDLEEEYYFRYSQTLKAIGNYEEANAVMHDYLLRSNNREALVNFEKENKTLKNVSAIGNRFEIKNLALNTENSEFGAVKCEQNLVFSGVKKKAGLFDKMYKWNNEPYLDLLTIPFVSRKSGDSIVRFLDKEVNTPMHESNAVFTKDGKTIYFTRNNYKKGKRGENKDKISNLKIFRGEFVEGRWTNIISLPFNTDDYSVEHPALSSDESTLYFSSDMPGTLGSFDIFSVKIVGSGYGTPINLGHKINTSRREQFPFVSKDSKLYFSSDGHGGYGSLDVFVSEIQNNSFSDPLNVGLPINSGFDDFSFNIDSDSKEGFFASNRVGGKGNDDIYELKETKPLMVEDCMQFIAGVVTDVDTKLALANVLISLQNSDKVEIQRIITLDDGKFSFNVVCEASYSVYASKEDYTKDSKSVIISEERNISNNVDLALRLMAVIINEEQLVLQIKKSEELVLLEQKKKEAVALVEKAKKQKEIAAKKEVELLEIKKREKVDQIIAAEKDVVRLKERLIIKTEPIYFDYDLWYIRKESKPILNRVIDLMKKYPEMIVEIGSHTDNRGDDKYNMNLSSQRAESTKEYFINQGVAKERIIAKGYGETVQIIKCEPIKSCSEEQHELNRRSVFIIKSL